MKIDSLDSEYQTAAQPASSTKVNNSSKDDQQMFDTNNPYVLPLQSTQTDWQAKANNIQRTRHQPDFLSVALCNSRSLKKTNYPPFNH